MDQNKLEVIAVGGGPAGISLAIECIELGMDPSKIIVFEKGEASIKAIRQFYPDKKMTLANYKNLPTETHGHLPCFPDLTKAETITYFDELIDRYKIDYRLNSEVSKIAKEAANFAVHVNQDVFRAKTVGIGIGILGRPNKPSYKIPLGLRSKVLFDLSSQNIQASKVLVIGGGDTSSEYCQILAAEGFDVSLAVRSDNLEKMMESNQKAVESLVANSRLRVMMNQSIKIIEDSGGRPKVVFEGERAHEEYDYVVFAIGGTTPTNFLKTVGIDCDDKNLPIAGESGETNIPGLYLLGDLVCGKTGGSIITAYNASFRTAKHILCFLNES